MALKDRIEFLNTSEQVDEFLRRHPDSVLFKAGTCHKTQETFAQVQPHLEGRGDLPIGVIRVVESRAASHRVAELTGIRHESPQLVLFRGGKAVFDRDNWDITADSIAEALQSHFTPVP
jgi:bacillithiol system protein YtxJ